MTVEKDYQREEKLQDIGHLINDCIEKDFKKVPDLGDLISSAIDRDYEREMASATRPKDLGQLVQMTIEKDYSQAVDQDQQVPDSSFNIVRRDSGARVTQQKAATPGIPDFDTLLTDLAAVGALDTQDTHTADSSLDIMDIAYTDRSFYDDYGVAHVKKEPVFDSKTVDLALMKSATMPLPASSQEALYGSDLTLLGEESQYNYYPNPRLPQTVNEPAASQGMDDLALTSVEHYGMDSDYETLQKIDRASIELGISKNPYQWEAEHSHRWAEWTLKLYNLPVSYVMDFYMDGTLMCMLTNEDFQKRCPQYGDYLYAELELWKSAYSFISSPLHNNSSSCTSDEDEPCYTDLSCSNGPNPAPNSTMTCIPTPVIMAPTYSSAVQYREPTLMQAAQGHRTPGPPRSVQPCVSPAPSVDSLSSSGHSTWQSSPEDMSGMLADSTYEMATHMAGAGGRGKHAIHLWQFLKELLLQPQSYHNCIRWLDRSKGIFKIEDSTRVAKLWGQRKNRPAMNYDKLSRSIRQYYKKGIIKKTENSKRLVYQFQPQYR